MIAADRQPADLDVTESKTWRVGTLVYTLPGLVNLFGWLLWGDFAWAMKERTVGPIMQVILKQHGASDFFTSLLMGSLPPIVTLVLNPMISVASDRHRGPWGRRIPFLFIPTPVAALAILGLAFCAPISSILAGFSGLALGQGGFILLTIALFWSTFEVATAICSSVFGALVNDVVPRAVLGRFNGAFRALSLIAAIFFNYFLIGKAADHYTEIFLAIGLLYGFGFSLMCWKVKEGNYPPPPPRRARSLASTVRGIASYFRECFGHSYYWKFYVWGASAQLCFMPFNLFNYYYARELQMDLTSYGLCLTVTYVISMGLAVPLGYLADRVHPLRLGLFVLSAYVFVMILGGTLSRDAHIFSIALVAHGVLAGTYLTATASMGQRLLPRDKFAQFGSASGIIGGLAGTFLAPAIGLLLDFTHHNYRITFFMNAGIGLFALCVGVLVYRQFLALGGPKAYSPPTP